MNKYIIRGEGSIEQVESLLEAFQNPEHAFVTDYADGEIEANYFPVDGDSRFGVDVQFATEYNTSARMYAVWLLFKRNFALDLKLAKVA